MGPIGAGGWRGWLRGLGLRKQGAAVPAPSFPTVTGAPGSPVPHEPAATQGEGSASFEALLVARQVQRYEIERWRAAFDRLPEACLLLNQAGGILFANAAAARLLEIAPQPGAGPQLEEVLARMPAAQRPSVWREPLPGARGSDLGSVVVLRDPASERRLESAIAEFLSHIAHELKSPLSTIRSYSEMLQDGSIEKPDTRREFFNVITDETSRLAKLIDNLLDLSKLDTGALTPKKARLRADALVQELLRACEPQARAKGLQLQGKVPPNLPTVFGDKDLIGVAVSNLISNAIKYTPSGGRVQVRAVAEDESLVIEVEDSGIGIRPEDRAHLFEKFFRGSGPEVRKQPGTGLGLALAQQIVKLHGGQLGVDSQSGRGSTFRIVLPLGGREQREAFGLPEGS